MAHIYPYHSISTSFGHRISISHVQVAGAILRPSTGALDDQIQGWMLGVEGDLVEGMLDQPFSTGRSGGNEKTQPTVDGLHHDDMEMRSHITVSTLRLAKLQTDPIDEATIEHQSMLQFLMNICLQGKQAQQQCTVSSRHLGFMAAKFLPDLSGQQW